MNKSIAYITVDYPPDTNAGAQRAYHLVRSLREHFDVLVLTTDKGVPLEAGCIQAPSGNPQGNSNYFGRVKRELQFLLFVLLRLKRAKFDVVFLCSPPFATLLLAVVLALRRMPFVLDVRDLYPDVFFDSGILKRSSPIGWLLRAIERLAYRKPVAIFTVCNSLLHKLQERSATGKVYLLENGHEVPAAYTSDRFVPGRGPLQCVIHGNFGAFQDVDLINEIVASTQHLPLVFNIIGFGARYSEVLEHERVKKLGRLPHAEVLKIVGGCNLGLSVRTSDDTGRNAIPVKLLEYVGVGLPSLAVPRSMDLELLEDVGCIRQFNKCDLPQIVAFFENCLADEEFLGRMRESCLLNRDRYKRSAINQKAVNIIKEVCRI